MIRLKVKFKGVSIPYATPDRDGKLHGIRDFLRYKVS